MKSTKTTAILFYIAALFSYATVIITYLTDGSFAIFYLLLGSAMLCLGSATALKQKNQDNEE